MYESLNLSVEILLHISSCPASSYIEGLVALLIIPSECMWFFLSLMLLIILVSSSAPLSSVGFGKNKPPHLSRKFLACIYICMDQSRPARLADRQNSLTSRNSHAYSLCIRKKDSMNERDIICLAIFSAIYRDNSSFSIHDLSSCGLISFTW